MSVIGMRKHIQTSTYHDHQAIGHQKSPKPGELDFGGNENNYSNNSSSSPGCSENLERVNKDFVRSDIEFVKAYTDLIRGKHKLVHLEKPTRMRNILLRLNEIEAVIEMEMDRFIRDWG